MNEEERSQQVWALFSALHEGGMALQELPTHLVSVLDSEAWRSFRTPLGHEMSNASVTEFTESDPPKGLGASVHLMDSLLVDYPEAKARWDAALARKGGGYKRTSNTSALAPKPGTQREAYRRLRRDRPDLHTRVLAGELSPHAAMLEAGFRHPTITVPLDDMARLARALRKHLDADQLRALINELAK